MKILSEQDIHLLIRDRFEESSRLEFKAGDAIDSSESKKKEIAKDVSAFANSAGGTVVYGIAEVEHKAHSIKPVNGSLFTKEWLEHVIDSNITRRIPGIEIVPIRINDNIAETVYVVHIPESTEAPHMAPDNRFYRRLNFKCMQMEEYEIRQLYFRTRVAKLRLVDLGVSPGGASTSGLKFNSVNFRIDFQVENESQVIEQHYKLEIWMPELMRHQVNAVSAVNKSLTRKELNHSVYSVPNASPLFAGERTTLASAQAVVEKGTLFHLKETEVICKLYFSGGIQEYTLNLTPHLLYGGKQLTMDMFVQ